MKATYAGICLQRKVVQVVLIRASHANQFPRSHTAETALSNQLRAALGTKLLVD